MSAKKKSLEVDDIKKVIPHRYPFLFVDKVTDIRENGLTAIKNVTATEYYFQGHFPDYPVMPGVLQLEALAQAGAIYVIYTYNLKNKPVYFMAIDKVKFRSQVVPGDTLTLEIELIRWGGKISKCRGRALVGDKVAVEAEMTAMIEID